MSFFSFRSKQAGCMGVRARKFSEVRKFLPLFPKIARKILANFCANIFSWRPFLDHLQKWVFMWFCQHWALFFPGFSEILRRFSQILFRFLPSLPGFSEIVPGFSLNQNSYTAGSVLNIMAVVVITLYKRVLKSSFQSRHFSVLAELPGAQNATSLNFTQTTTAP